MCEKRVGLSLKISQFAGVVAVIIASGAADNAALAQSKEIALPASDNFRAAQDLFTDNNKIIDLELELDTPDALALGTDGQIGIVEKRGGVRLNSRTKPGELSLERLRPPEELEGELNTRKGGISLRYKLPLGQKKRP